MLLVVPLGNTSFLGIPVIEALLGNDAIPYLLVYDQFGTFLILSFYATAVVATYEAGRVHKRQIFKKLLLFPPFGFLLFGLLFGEMPPTILPYVQTLSNTLVPLALISVGYSLHFGKGLEYGLLTQGLIVKLFIMPLVAFGILWAFHIDPLVLKTAVLESAMPSMITAGALAIAAGFAPRLAAAMVGYGLIVSLVTLPLWLWAMERILG
jgi:predicted permease